MGGGGASGGLSPGGTIFGAKSPAAGPGGTFFGMAAPRASTRRRLFRVSNNLLVFIRPMCILGLIYWFRCSPVLYRWNPFRKTSGILGVMHAQTKKGRLVSKHGRINTFSRAEEVHDRHR